MRSLFPSASELKLSLLYPVLKLAAVDQSQQVSDGERWGDFCGENHFEKGLKHEDTSMQMMVG